MDHFAPELMTKAVMDTDAGQITLELFDADAPNTVANFVKLAKDCLLYTSPSPRDKRQSRMPSSA